MPYLGRDMPIYYTHGHPISKAVIVCLDVKNKCVHNAREKISESLLCDTLNHAVRI